MAAAGFIEEKLRFAIVLALTAGGTDAAVLLQQDERARQLGMTRAEVSAARQGFSFDYRTSKALALALAWRNGSARAQRGESLRAGIDAQTCARIERLAAELSTASSFGGKKNAT